MPAGVAETETLVRRLVTPTAAERATLADLLVATVDLGASVGFLPPLARAEAAAYWATLPDRQTILLVAEREGRIVGTVQANLARKANGRHRAEIGKLLVHPDARRQGIARRLMAAAETAIQADGRSLVILDTRDGDPSNALYQRLGYFEGGRMPNYARSADGTLHTTIFYYKLPHGNTTAIDDRIG